MFLKTLALIVSVCTPLISYADNFIPRFNGDDPLIPPGSGYHMLIELDRIQLIDGECVIFPVFPENEVETYLEIGELEVQKFTILETGELATLEEVYALAHEHCSSSIASAPPIGGLFLCGILEVL